MKVLITSGPTREPIDGVRFITNLSSGFTGKTLAEYFTGAGHEVVFIFGEGSMRPKGDLRQLRFATFDELNAQLRQVLDEERFDVVIHAAAVSDFGVAAVVINGEVSEAPLKGKLASAQDVEIKLRRHFKILDRIKSYARQNDAPLLVAFKLTNTADEDQWRAAVAKLNQGGGVDYVVHNDLSQRLSNDKHHFYISGRQGPLAEAGSAKELAVALEKLLVQEVMP